MVTARSVTLTSTIMVDKNFAYYMVGELLWELEQFKLPIAQLQRAAPEDIEVLSYSGYSCLRVRVASSVFDVQLSWRGDVAPIIQTVSDDAP